SLNESPSNLPHASSALNSALCEAPVIFLKAPCTVGSTSPALTLRSTTTADMPSLTRILSGAFCGDFYGTPLSPSDPAVSPW
ncbi:hypothetical protein LTR39_006290, partial [Cryomyces antarcticus]